MFDVRPPTEKQLNISKWFGKYKHIEHPIEICSSHPKWWKWVNESITKIDREDAHAAMRDFNLKVDFTNPIDIIGALKYRFIVVEIPIEELAIAMLKRNIHPIDVEIELSLSQQQIDEAVKKVVLDGYEIDWGSV